MNSWYKRGFGAIGRSVSDGSSGTQPFRCSVYPGDEREIIFVDSDPFCYFEHQVQVNGRPLWLACLKQIGKECLLCEHRNEARHVALFTVITLGMSECGPLAVPRNYRNVLAANSFLASILAEELKSKGGTLIGCRYSMRHAYDYVDQPREIFKFRRRVDLREYNSPRPFDYERIFAPLSESQMANVVRRANDEGSGPAYRVG